MRYDVLAAQRWTPHSTASHSAIICSVITL